MENGSVPHNTVLIMIHYDLRPEQSWVGDEPDQILIRLGAPMWSKFRVLYSCCSSHLYYINSPSWKIRGMKIINLFLHTATWLTSGREKWSSVSPSSIFMATSSWVMSWSVSGLLRSNKKYFIYIYIKNMTWKICHHSNLWITSTLNFP